MSEILNVLQNIKGAKFAGVTYTSDKSGEKSRYTILLGANYDTLVKKSLDELTALYPEVAAVVGDALEVKTLVKVLDAEKAAAAELLASFNATIAGFATGTKNPAYTKAHVYTPVFDGVTRHKTDNSLELSGLVIKKVVLEEGEHKFVNSSPKTIWKNKIRKQLSVGKFRTLKLEGENFHSLRFGNTEFETIPAKLDAVNAS